jgi:hemerythrin-like domain-containing protein
MDTKPETGRTAGPWRAFLQEHALLRKKVEGLRRVADMVGDLNHAALRAAVASIHQFLAHELLVHIAVEERVLYPAIARVKDLGETAETMRRDHAEISELERRVTGLRDRLEQGTFGPEDPNELRRVLYGLYELLKIHMAKEEEICLPMLEKALSEDQLRMLDEGMELFEAAEQASE